jgi:pilus assembly protein FimV
MFRKSALAMAMLGALTTGNVVALGLGEIELKSALNQPLNAEVELLSATQAELDELKVMLGSSQAFAKAGIQRPLFLNKIKFAVNKNPDGKPVVRIYSREVVREPFLDFLLEVSWSKGRLLREYTVLVDPPVTMPATPPPVQAAAVQPVAPAPVARPAPVQPARRVTHTAQMPPVSVAPGEYLTKRHDTLWGVAQRVRPDTGVSIEQTMLGLQRANPEAFINNNINNLKAGYILRVPGREEMTAVSRAQARQEARAQYEAWREERALPEVARRETAAGTAEGGAVAVESHLQLVAPETAEGGASASDSGQMAELQRELMMANEALEAQRRQGEEMSGRLSVLEEQILNMQRLIQLKDDELAKLQSQAAGETAGQAPAEMDVAEPQVMEETAAAPLIAGEETGVAEPAPADAAAEVAVGEETAIAEVEETVEPLTGPPVMPETVTEQAPVAAQPEPAPVEAVVPPQTTPAPGFVDRLLANPLWLGAGVVVLALLAFFGLRRKRGVETEFQESILQAAQGKSDTATDSEIVASEPASSDTTSSQSSLLSEFAVSDMGSMKNDGEADPLAEADVYLAYGRYQQAEDLIKEALDNDAEREDLNLKLLEVFLAAKNQVAFDEHAQSIMDRFGGSDSPMWEKVADMGRELSPDNPLYQGGGEPAPAAEAEADIVEGLDSLEDMDMDFKQDEGVAEPESALAADENLDFDIDLSFDETSEKAERAPESAEFTPPQDVQEPAEASGQPLDMDMGSVEPEAGVEEAALDFDLEGLDLDTEEETGVAGEGELADLDEVSTKLDLARAYIDMGDPDGARSILDEVIDEGSDDQKHEARGILEKMT